MKNSKKILTKLFLLIFCFSLVTSCKKDEKVGVNNSQIGLYSLVFSESNNNIGVAIIAILQVGDKIDVDNFIFRFNEKDESKVRDMCYKFNQAIIEKDNEIIQNQALGDFIQTFFSKQGKFRSNSKLNKNQLENLVNRKNFNVAFISNNTDGNLLLSILNSFIPSANAQNDDNVTGLIKTYTSVLVASVTTVGAINAADVLPTAIGSGPLLTRIIIGGGVTGIALLVATELDIPTIKGATSPLNTFTTLVNGSSTLADSMYESFVGQVLTGLDPSYSRKNSVDIRKELKEIFDKYIDSNNSTKYTATTEDVIGIHTDPECNCTLIGPKLTFVAKSTSTSKNNNSIYTGICIGTTNNLSISNSVVLKGVKGLGLFQYEKIPARGLLIGGEGVGEFKIEVMPNRDGTYYYRTFIYMVFGPNKIVLPLFYGEEKSFTIAPLG